MYCPNCGAKVKKESFCPSCGKTLVKLDKEAKAHPPTPEKSKKVLFIPLVIIGLLIVLAGGYVFLTKLTKPPESRGLTLLPYQESKISLGDAQIIVPKEGVTGQAEIKVSKIPAAKAPQPDKENKIVGDVYQLDTKAEIKADKPTTITLNYSPSKLPEGATEDNLYLARWNGTAWEPVPGAVVNTQTKTISAPVDHFSYYAIMAGFGKAVIEYLWSDKIEAKSRFADLPDGIKQDLDKLYSQSSVKSGIYWRLSQTSRKAASTILVANFINQINGGVMAAIKGGKEAVADWLAEELAKQLAGEVLAEQTSETTAEFTILLYDSAKLGFAAGSKIGEMGFKAAASSADLGVEVASWILETEMNYINENLPQGYQKIAGLDFWTGLKPLEIYIIGVDGENKENGFYEKGVKFYYLDYEKNNFVNYFNDVVATEIKDVKVVEKITPTEKPKPSPTPKPTVSGGCQTIDLSSAYKNYWLYDSQFPCPSFQRSVSTNKFSIRCPQLTSRWREHYVKEIAISGASKLRIKANLGLYVHDKFFIESGGVGVKYDDYVSLWVVSEDPNPTLSSECNQGYTQDTIAKCAIPNTHPGLLGKCGVAKFTASKNCDFEVNVSGLNKVYLVFYTSDAWPADPEGSLNNVQICY